MLLSIFLLLHMKLSFVKTNDCVNPSFSKIIVWPSQHWSNFGPKIQNFVFFTERLHRIFLIFCMKLIFDKGQWLNPIRAGLLRGLTGWGGFPPPKIFRNISDVTIKFGTLINQLLRNKMVVFFFPKWLPYFADVIKKKKKLPIFGKNLHF